MSKFSEMRPRSQLVLRGEGDEPYPEQGVSSCLGWINDEFADSDLRLNHMIPQSDPKDTPPIKNEIPSPPQTRKGMTHSSGKCERSHSSSPTVLLSKRKHPFVRPGGVFSFALECRMMAHPVITHTALQINGTAKVFLTRRDSLPTGEEKKVALYRDLKRVQNLDRIVNYLHFIKERSIKRKRDGKS